MCFPHVRPEVFASELIEWTEALLERHVFLKKIVICELFIRDKPRFVDAQTDEIRRRVANQMLKDMAEVQRDMIFWRHLRLMHSPLNILGVDGVHLSSLGTKKFYRSMRLAILHAIR